MLDEKKRIDIGNMRIAGCLNQGGKVEENDDRKGIPGIDFPVSESDMNF
jgi:hypothetical protein